MVKTCGQSDFSSSFSKKLKSPETRLFQGFFEYFEEKIFGLVNAVSRSVLHRFFVWFLMVLGAFVSRNGANPCSSKHCFHVVRVCRWSKMWSNAVFCGDHIFIFSKRYTHVRVYSFKGSLAYYRELVKSFADFLSINILKCSFVFQFCTLKLHFKNTRKLFLSPLKIWYAVNKEKGNGWMIHRNVI